jgi:hypothetical protein
VPAGGYYSGSVTLVNGVPHAVFPAYFIDGPCIGVNAWNGLLPQFFRDNLKTMIYQDIENDHLPRQARDKHAEN